MVLENFLADADILWDRAGKKLFEKPEARTGRIMRVQVTNRGVVEDLTGYTLNLGWTSTKDETKIGLDAFEAADITKGIFELEYTSGMLTNIGTLKATLQLVPVAGNTVESDNFVITVTKSAVDAAAVQSETSFTALASALVSVNDWNMRIDDVEQDFIDRANNLDATYPTRLVSVEQQLADKANKNLLDNSLKLIIPPGTSAYNRRILVESVTPNVNHTISVGSSTSKTAVTQYSFRLHDVLLNLEVASWTFNVGETPQEHTFNVTKEGVALFVYAGVQGFTTNKQLTLNKMKLEEGVERTPWTESEFDGLSKQNDIAAIKQNANWKPTVTNANAFASFVWDDCWAEDISVVLPFLNTKGVKGGFACLTNAIDTAEYMTLADLKNLYENGHEILSHTVTHIQLDLENPDTVEYELSKSKSVLNKWGIPVTGIVYPRNYYNANVANLASKYYDYAMTMDEVNHAFVINKQPFNQYGITRIYAEAPLASNQAYIDEVAAKGGWIVLMGHGMYYNQTKHPDTSRWPGKWDVNIQNMKDNINYCITKGLLVDTPGNIIKNYGNLITIGDELINKKERIALNKKGSALGKPFINYMDGNTTKLNANSPIADFPIGISVISYHSTDGHLFPMVGGNDGGMLITCNFGDRLVGKELSYQEWHVSNQGGLIYKRVNTSGGWGAFNIFRSTVVKNVQVDFPIVPANGSAYVEIAFAEANVTSLFSITNLYYAYPLINFQVSASSRENGKILIIVRNNTATERAAQTGVWFRIAIQ